MSLIHSKIRHALLRCVACAGLSAGPGVGHGGVMRYCIWPRTKIRKNRLVNQGWFTQTHTQL